MESLNKVGKNELSCWCVVVWSNVGRNRWWWVCGATPVAFPSRNTLKQRLCVGNFWHEDTPSFDGFWNLTILVDDFLTRDSLVLNNQNMYLSAEKRVVLKSNRSRTISSMFAMSDLGWSVNTIDDNGDKQEHAMLRIAEWMLFNGLGNS